MGSATGLHAEIAKPPLIAALTHVRRIKCDCASAYPQHWGDLTKIPSASRKPARRRRRPAEVPTGYATNRISPARRDSPCLANLYFTAELNMLSLAPTAAMPQALTPRIVCDRMPWSTMPLRNLRVLRAHVYLPEPLKQHLDNDPAVQARLRSSVLSNPPAASRASRRYAPRNTVSARPVAATRPFPEGIGVLPRERCADVKACD